MTEEALKIGVCVQFDSSFKPVADVTIPVLANYCHKHGYSLNIQQNPRIHESIVRDRIKRLRDALPEYDWVVHFDADALVTNHSIKLESFLDNHIVVCEGRTEKLEVLLCDGIILVKNSPEGFRFLNRVGEHVKRPIQELQEAYANEPEFRSMIKVWPQNTFSSFLYTEYDQPDTTGGHAGPDGSGGAGSVPES